VITMLADDAAVEAVTFGPSGLLGGLGETAVHVGMSTISVALSRRLAREHAEARRAYVAAPVFGRPEAAAARKLWIVVGGADEAIARCAPIFSALGQGIFPMGTAAQASLAKLAGNYLIAATIESVGEALVLGEKGDIDPGRLFAMLSGTLFGSPVFNGYGNRIAKTEFIPPGFTMTLGLKDVDLALAAARELGAPMPVAELARSRLLTAIERGRGDHDFAGFASVIREAAGLPGARK
jgi:3-hydroxyisobutyrate dehydrogenase-like beta-hydroxyacid dehydrogenase